MSTLPLWWLILHRLTSLYVSSGEGSRNQDEIDVEFHTGSHKFHTYSIHGNKRKIQWFIDSKLVRTVRLSGRMRSGARWSRRSVDGMKLHPGG